MTTKSNAKSKPAAFDPKPGDYVILSSPGARKPLNAPATFTFGLYRLTISNARSARSQDGYIAFGLLPLDGVSTDRAAEALGRMIDRGGGGGFTIERAANMHARGYARLFSGPNAEADAREAFAKVKAAYRARYAKARAALAEAIDEYEALRQDMAAAFDA